MTQCPKLLALHCRSFSGCGNECVINIFRNSTDLYNRFGRMLEGSPLIAQWVGLKMVDSLLTLTLLTMRQPLYTQWLYATNHILIIAIQYWVCMYYRFHPVVLLPLNFWSSAIYAIWVRNNVALAQSRAFGRHLTACRWFHQFLGNTAQLRHHSVSSSFSSICITY
jgi:hypothetical protein